ncbi:glycosyltransferase family 39 protein [Spirulina sp. 06S082]|uniref:glycosyltransferase family 39 protein n=1 Tax=Spirulina sp. 06S082 TaxID=3110248 RepID=UPI002B206735|nr:glycosyltransferase family 39 protein [Spirulina sp. 06S082]MEA5467489.1 glycosyltransferase family 39 protein [Spirulina sp. 06S082]
MKEVKSPTKLHWFFIIVLILGIFFRFYNLDGQVYWHDEALTSSRIAGYTKNEIRSAVFTGEIIRVQDLQKYQSSSPEKNFWDTIKVLATDANEHPPLYYGLLRLWANIFGFSITAIRCFSVIISLLIFPCLYWLCWELFRSELIGWMAIAIVSLSPYFVIYAREAREYSLWTVLTLLVSVLLLRAIRCTHNEAKPQENLKNWGGYAIALTLGFYTFPLSGIMAIGQGLYLIIIEKFRWTRSVLFYITALIFSLLAFSPWLTVMIINSSKGTSWTAFPLPFSIWLKLWAMHFSHGFVFIVDEFGFNTLLNYSTLPFLLLLIFSAFYFLCRNTPRQIWLFILILTLTLPLFLVLPDLILGGQRSTSSRYLVPMYLGIQIAIAYLLATPTHKPRLQKSITLLIITLGLISCLFYVNSETSWNKVVSFNNPKIVQAIAQSNNPLLITVSFGINSGNILALSHALDPNLNLLLINNSGDRFDWEIIPDLPSEFSDLYFLNTSDRFLQTLESEYNLETKLIYHDNHLWLWKST